MILSVALLVASTGTARAWGNRGHEVVALIAYHELDDAPAVQQQIQNLLKKHPHYETYLSKNPPQGIPLEDCVVMRAATWPDWARDKPRYHRPTWHYVNKPLLIGADAETRLEVEKAFSSRKENHGDVLTAFPDCRRTVRDAAAEEADRAVKLCWVFHLAGDIHQPLHATALCTKDLPAGDQGGNLVRVRRRPGLNPTSLHSLWDHLLDREGADAVAGARDIRMNVAFTAAERKVGDIGAWAEESFDLAKSHAYSFDGVLLDFVIDPEGEAEAPAVPENYEKEAVKVARKRAVLAGVRLADVLKADLGN
jgi:hypothetical protein